MFAACIQPDRSAPTCAASAPVMRMGATSVSGRLPPPVIQGVVREHRSEIQACYDKGNAYTPGLRGRVVVRFVVGRDGELEVRDGGSDLPSAWVVDCIMKVFYGMEFPPPDGGIATVVYPIMFCPPAPATAPTTPASAPTTPPPTPTSPPPDAAPATECQ